MMLVAAGPLVALFDPKDGDHARCVTALESISEPLHTTVPVLTESFHLLGHGSKGAAGMRQFVTRRGLVPWFLGADSLDRAFELMDDYADRPMDLADASLVVAAEVLGTRRIFTLDRNDFDTYRVKRGHRHYAFDVLDPRRAASR